jgi:hypothetical protein
MNYLLTPLHKHADLGFGATAHSYKEAADYLEVNGAELVHFNGHLPINFLRRHAIELYLKIGHHHLSSGSEFPSEQSLGMATLWFGLSGRGGDPYTKPTNRDLA